MGIIKEKTFTRIEKGLLYQQGYFLAPTSLHFAETPRLPDHQILATELLRAKAVYLVFSSVYMAKAYAPLLFAISQKVSVFAIFSSREIYQWCSNYRILFRYCKIDKNANVNYIGFDTEEKRFNFLLLEETYQTTDIFLWKYFQLESARKKDDQLFSSLSHLTVFDRDKRLEEFALSRAQAGQKVNYVQGLKKMYLKQSAKDPIPNLIPMFWEGSACGVYGVGEDGDVYRVLSPEKDPILIKIKHPEFREITYRAPFILQQTPSPLQRETGLYVFYDKTLTPFDSLETMELSKTYQCESFDEFERINQAPPFPEDVNHYFPRYRAVICTFTITPPYLDKSFLPHPKNNLWHNGIKGWNRAFKPQKLSQMIESITPLSSQGKSELETLAFELDYANEKIIANANKGDESFIAWLGREKNTVNYYLGNAKELFIEIFDQVSDTQDSDRLISIQGEIDALSKKIKEKEKQLKANPDDLGAEKRIERLKTERANLMAIKKRAEGEKPKRAVSGRRAYLDYLEELCQKKKQSRGDEVAFLRVRGDKETSKVELFYDFTDLYFLRYMDFLNQIITALDKLITAPLPDKFGLYIKDGKTFVAFSDSDEVEDARKYAITQNAQLVVERR